MTHYINVIVHSCCLILPFLLLPGVYAIYEVSLFHQHYIVKIPKKFTVQYHFFGYLQQKTDTRVVSLYSFAEILEHLKVILIFHFDVAFAI